MIKRSKKSHNRPASPPTPLLCIRRALQKLCDRLQAHHINGAPAILEAALLAASKQAAPTGFADRATAALELHSSAAVASTATTVASLLLLRKALFFTAIAAAALLVVGIVTLALKASTAPTTIAVTTRPAIDPNWRQTFDAAYTSPTAKTRRIRNSISTRHDFQSVYYHLPAFNGRGNGPVNSRAAGNTSDLPDAMDLEWDPQSRRVERITRVNWGAWAFESLTVNLIGLRPDQFMMPAKMTGITLAGDWVFRKGATPEQKLESFRKQLDKSPAAFVFEKKTLDRQVVVIHGNYNPADFPAGKIGLQLTPNAPQKLTQAGDVGYFIRHMTMAVGRPFINEWTGSEHAYIEFPPLKDVNLKGLPPEAQDIQAPASFSLPFPNNACPTDPRNEIDRNLHHPTGQLAGQVNAIEDSERSPILQTAWLTRTRSASPIVRASPDQRALRRSPLRI